MDNSFFQKFAPKEPKFFPLLRDMADVISSAADLIVDCVQTTTHDDAVRYYQLIKAQEKRGDLLLRVIFDELNVSFITPFDREDINHLANEMDDITDFINGSAKKIVLFKPKKIPTSALELAKQIKEGSDIITDIMSHINNLKSNGASMKEQCEKLHEIETAADNTYEHFLINLFENEKDSIEIIKLKEIMSVLEKATDAIDYVGKIVQSIIVKYT
jgi:uncharacterized protein Yka (UPF0111/DUF47 family)